MSHIADLAERLEEHEKIAGEQGWGGEYREEIFGEMVQWLQEKRKYTSVGLLLVHLICKSIEMGAVRNEGEEAYKEHMDIYG